VVARKVVLVAAVVALIGAAGFLVYSELPTQGCQAPSSTAPSRYQAGKIQFGAVTEYCLASPQRWANAITVAPDGSVWFGEQAFPGVGQLFANGTVVEHAWPSANGSAAAVSGYQTGIWGVELWRGMVWGTNADENSIVGYSPTNGTFKTLVLPLPYSQPYALTTGPDGALWFTSFAHSPTLGRVSPSFTVSMYPVFANRDELPVEIQFANSSLGYYVALDPNNGARSGLYSFVPENVSGGVRPLHVGGNFSLIDANSLSLSPTTVWVAQHLVSSIAGYDLTSQTWTVYPTSTLPFTNTALPYFVRSSGSTVWFNEHYANRIGALSPTAGTLTEYSEADPPISAESALQNDLTIAVSPAGLWFTSTTGNYIGLVIGSHPPGFTLSASGPNSLPISPGESTSVQLRVTGAWSTELKVSISDSENYTSFPSLISIQPDKTVVPSGAGPVPLTVALSAKDGIQPGRYTVGVTVTDGLVYQTAYLFVTVE
jgi:streptogramin lyase